MITDENILKVKSYVENWQRTQKKNAIELEFSIGIYNHLNPLKKLTRKKCGCDFKDKFNIIGKWIKTME